MSLDLFWGWLLGVVSSIASGIVLFWLQGRRDIKREILRQRQEDIRIARDWASDGKKVSLRGFDLRGANLSGKDLSGADLEDANFEGAAMWSTNLTEANLIQANFQNAELVGAKFVNANLFLSDFSGAILKAVDFTNAKLSRAKLRQAKRIEYCDWTSVSIDEKTELSNELRQKIHEQLLPQPPNETLKA